MQRGLQALVLNHRRAAGRQPLTDLPLDALQQLAHPRPPLVIAHAAYPPNTTHPSSARDVPKHRGRGAHPHLSLPRFGARAEMLHDWIFDAATDDNRAILQATLDGAAIVIGRASFNTNTGDGDSGDAGAARSSAT